MDFIEWCDFVLAKLAQLSAEDVNVRSYGADEYTIAAAIWGPVAGSQPEFHESKQHIGMLGALDRLVSAGLLGKKGNFYQMSVEGRAHATDPTRFWQQICQTDLQDDQKELLAAVNHHSPNAAEDHAWLEQVEGETLLQNFEWQDGLDRLIAVGKELMEHALVSAKVMPGPHVALTATYEGLVWEFRRDFTMESQFIDRLVREWETTSVEFKRELETKTADQKAELIKDVIALANTRASAPHLLIVGFDDETQAYYGPPNPAITQEHLEQLMSQYTEPVVDVRYRVVDYRLGRVGKLEVLRDPRKLPYKVKKSVGYKKRIQAGDVFVRHCSLVEEPTELELKAIEEEGRRAMADTTP